MPENPRVTPWRKSSRSGANGNCVELRRNGDMIEMRDSKDPQGPRLKFTPAEIVAFLGGAKDSEFDDLV